MRWTTMAVMVLALAGCEPEDATKLDDTGDLAELPLECPPANRYAWIGTECSNGWALAHQVTFFHRAQTDGCKFWAKDAGDWSVVLETHSPGGDAWVMRGGQRLAHGTWAVQPRGEATPELMLLTFPPALDGQSRAPFTCPDGEGIALFAASPS